MFNNIRIKCKFIYYNIMIILFEIVVFKFKIIINVIFVEIIFIDNIK